MLYADISDVELFYGPITDDARERVGWLIDLAEEHILRGRDLEARVAAGDTTVRLIAQVAGEMVNAFLRNEGGAKATYQQDMVGPFSRQLQQSFETSTVRGTIRLTDDQKALLGDRMLPGAYTVPLGGP